MAVVRDDDDDDDDVTICADYIIAATLNVYPSGYSEVTSKKSSWFRSFFFFFFHYSLYS
jgi:hypothetical protein